MLYVGAKNEQLKAGRGQLYNKFADAILGMSDWIFSGQSQVFVKKYDLLEEELLVIENRKNRFTAYRDFLSQLIIGIGVVLIIWWSNEQVGLGVFSPTLVAAFALALLSLGEVFMPVASAISERTTYVASVQRLHAMEDNSLPNWEAEGKEAEKTMIFPEMAPLKVERLGYQYPGSAAKVINNLSLTIQPGEKWAIIGRSGTGKSTLLQLLQGVLQADSGFVTYGDINLATVGVHGSDLMGVLNQKAYLFDTTVENNIRMGKMTAKSEEIRAVAKQVGLDDLISQLPNGYKTQMQEAGERFSGGERQRIALARVLLQDTPIVILDEPTIGLDPITEKELLATMFETLKNKTVIWVTHHLIGVEKMDNIIFLENGSIELEGKHNQLLATNERYQRLYQLDKPSFDFER